MQQREVKQHLLDLGDGGGRKSKGEKTRGISSKGLCTYGSLLFLHIREINLDQCELANQKKKKKKGLT